MLPQIISKYPNINIIVRFSRNISYSLPQQIFAIIMNEAHFVQFIGTQHAALAV